MDIFPPYRHIVIVSGGPRRPVAIAWENEHGYSTAAGFFSKITGASVENENVRFEGPFTADGDMESRP